jgi:aspartate racemase
MKTLGLIGGTSWVSTVDYYKYINRGINERLGGLNFAKCIIYSFNFGELAALTDAGETAKVSELLCSAAMHLKNSGAEGIVLCANTMHMYAKEVGESIQLPIIHIATATADAISKQGLHTIGLLGTKFTMEKDFFKNKLSDKDIHTIIPNDEDREFIHKTIFEELGRDILLPVTKARYIAIINDLAARGAQGVILGCTEIPLLISQQDISIPAFDTVKIHAGVAVEFALATSINY